MALTPVIEKLKLNNLHKWYYFDHGAVPEEHFETRASVDTRFKTVTSNFVGGHFWGSYDIKTDTFVENEST